jgi:hypothetical protein
MCDTIELLRPKLRACTSWEEASQAAEALDKEFSAKLGPCYTSVAVYVSVSIDYSMLAIVWPSNNLMSTSDCQSKCCQDAGVMFDLPTS